MSKQLFSHNFAVHPGSLIEDYLQYYNLSVEDLADQTKIPLEQLKKIINENGKITKFVASKLEKIFKRSAKFWINVQKNYDKNKSWQQNHN